MGAPLQQLLESLLTVELAIGILGLGYPVGEQRRVVLLGDLEVEVGEKQCGVEAHVQGEPAGGPHFDGAIANGPLPLAGYR